MSRSLLKFHRLARCGLIRGKFKVESLQDTLSQVHCGNRANVRMVCHGTLLDPTTTIAFAAKVGPLRAKIFCLPGGVNWTLTPILTELQSLLLKHGHPSKEVEKKAHEVYDAVGHAGCKSILEAKNHWAMLKTEGTKHKLVLIPLAHRGSSKGRDELFEADPWANCGSKQQRQNRAKKVPTKTNNAVGRVDLSLFHDDKQPVSQVDLNQLFKVIAVCL